jgi:UDP-N-acetylmuramate dehydrogenase
MRRICANFRLDPEYAVMALGLGSNLIVRDGGVPGVVVRLGKAFARSRRWMTSRSTAAAGRGHSRVLHGARSWHRGLEFLRSIPGTVGGFVRMNGGAYGARSRTSWSIAMW